jgi:FlaA1/EpsC-like NDP-sugar epimerase
MGDAMNGRVDRSTEAAPTLPGRIVAHVRRDVPLALLDAVLIVVAYLVPLVLRLEGEIPADQWERFWRFLPGVVLVHLLANYLFGLYGQMWRYASVQEARRLVLAGTLALGLVLAGTLWLGRPLPLSVAILGAALTLMGSGAVRFQSRLFAFRRRSTEGGERRRVLLVGAGDAGAMVLRDILRTPTLALEPVGFVDDDPRKRGLSLHGVAVLGGRMRIPDLVAIHDVDEVLLTLPTATSDVVRDVAARCEEAGVSLRVLPSVREIVDGRVTARDLRDLRIEDLLGRQQVRSDLEAVRALLRGRRVLITGAGGSIGSEIARQVAGFEPSLLLLLDNDETHLHDVASDAWSAAPVTPLLADIRDRARVVDLVLEHRPEVVFHAAAHKHVPLLESHPHEALFTNVLGTANVADAAVAAGVERFVLISTDKAVRPVSVMGGSKRLAEAIVRSLEERGTAFCAVRFGNVLGSRGSVIPTFLRQIRAGGPVTVTDPGMIRYFMSVEEAVTLVLEAAALSSGGEVFTLEMGEPVGILDLARKLIRLSGRVPERDVAIVFTGARPGERLREELVDDAEDPVPAGRPGIVVSRPPPPDRPALHRTLADLERLARDGRLADLADGLRSPELRYETVGSTP